MVGCSYRTWAFLFYGTKSQLFDKNTLQWSHYVVDILYSNWEQEFKWHVGEIIRKFIANFVEPMLYLNLMEAIVSYSPQKSFQYAHFPINHPENCSTLTSLRFHRCSKKVLVSRGRSGELLRFTTEYSNFTLFPLTKVSVDFDSQVIDFPR